MKVAIVIAASLFAASSAVADPWARLRNATANELCWDTVRGHAREKHPAVERDDTATSVNLTTRPSEKTPPKQSRKAFPGIRNC
jgi:hypothetical protein